MMAIIEATTEINSELGPEAINQSIAPILQPLAERAHQLMGYTEYFLGGIFGLYLIFFIIRTIVDIKKNKLLKAIKEEIKQINEKIDKKR